MKKLCYRILSAMMITFLLCTLCVMPSFAATSATLTGTSTVRAGDSITLTLKVNATKSYGLSGDFKYDSSQVSISSVTDKITGWSSTLYGNKFVSEDNKQENPITKSTTVITAKFKVAKGVKTGDTLKISIDLTVDDNGQSVKTTASYTVKIAAQLSTDATLKALTVDGCTLSPKFSSSKTEYDVGEVEYSMSKLAITATTNNSGAKMEITGNKLSVGENIVTITITAESGATKTYSIKAIRKQDPNYVPSSDASLSTITLSTGIISPLITAGVTDYIAYVPYETEMISISGKTANKKAKGVTELIDAELEVGENEFTIIATAEDGTELAYTVTVLRMDKYIGKLDPIESLPVEDDVSESVSDDTSSEMSNETSSGTQVESLNASTPVISSNDDSATNGSGGVPTLAVVIIALVAIIIGSLGGMLFAKYTFPLRKNKH